ncbi:unnamed protein product [Durusdinium trenchii]|uniref:Uncharacterized protein n=1 Tax=Durusdinium trenchii TaxID=1381693 RepID=A0ABP0T2Q2_9DINO
MPCQAVRGADRWQPTMGVVEERYGRPLAATAELAELCRASERRSWRTPFRCVVDQAGTVRRGLRQPSGVATAFPTWSNRWLGKRPSSLVVDGPDGVGLRRHGCARVILEASQV